MRTMYNGWFRADVSRLIMGSAIGVICNACGARFEASRGGGFFFELLHCDACGGTKSVPHNELGDAHALRVRGLGGSWTVATQEVDKRVQQASDLEPLTGGDFKRLVERKAGKCDCGGSFRLDAPPRCPNCRSSDFTEDPEGGITMYD